MNTECWTSTQRKKFKMPHTKDTTHVILCFHLRNESSWSVDGKSTYDSDLTIPEAEQARIEGIQIFVIGVTENIDEPELRGMSSMPQVMWFCFILAIKYIYFLCLFRKSADAVTLTKTLMNDLEFSVRAFSVRAFWAIAQYLHGKTPPNFYTSYL